MASGIDYGPANNLKSQLVSAMDKRGKVSNIFHASGPSFIPQPGFRSAIGAVRAVERGQNQVEAARRGPAGGGQGAKHRPAGSPSGGQFY